MSTDSPPRRHGAAKVAALVRAALAVAALAAAFPVAAQQPASTFVTLGTNSGPIPNPARSQPANLLIADGRQILVDVGDATAEQLGKAGGRIETIDSVFVSHLHFDHIGGLFALLSRRYQVISPGVLTIYGPPGTKAVVDQMVGAINSVAIAGSVIRSRAGRAPAEGVKVIEVGDGAQVVLGAIKVTAAANSHYVAMMDGGRPADGPQSLSFRFDLPDRSITYTGDTGPSPAVERLAKGSDLLIAEIIDVDAVMARLRRTRPDVPPAAYALVERHHRLEHLEPAEIGKMAQRAGVKALVLTHNAVEPDGIEAARAAIGAIFKGSVRFAADLDRF